MADYEPPYLDPAELADADAAYEKVNGKVLTITDEMKAHVVETLGADFIAQNPEFNPENIIAYTLQGGFPAIRLGMLQVELDPGEEDQSWQAAWDKFMHALVDQKELISWRASTGLATNAVEQEFFQ